MPNLQTCREMPAGIHLGSDQVYFQEMLEREHFAVDYGYAIANFC